MFRDAPDGVGGAVLELHVVVRGVVMPRCVVPVDAAMVTLRVGPVDGAVVLVQFGAQEAAAKTALRLRLQNRKLARKKFVQVVVGL